MRQVLTRYLRQIGRVGELTVEEVLFLRLEPVHGVESEPPAFVFRQRL